MNKERGIYERAIEEDRKYLLFNTERKWKYKLGVKVEGLVNKGHTKCDGYIAVVDRKFESQHPLSHKEIFYQQREAFAKITC